MPIHETLSQQSDALPRGTSSIPLPSGIRGPRSRIVEAILLLLYAKPMKSSEIAKILNKNPKLISSYLSYWKTRGFVTYSSGYWMLTPIGEAYVRMLMDIINRDNKNYMDVVLLAHKLMTEKVRQTINNTTSPKLADVHTAIQLFTDKQTSEAVSKQSCLLNGLERQSRLSKALACMEKILGDRDLLEEEAYVLQYLVKHYIEWQSTYTYLDQLAEELHYDVRELLSILRKLQTKKLIYIYTDKRFGMRIGLNKSFKQLLDRCIEESWV